MFVKSCDGLGGPPRPSLRADASSLSPGASTFGLELVLSFHILGSAQVFVVEHPYSSRSQEIEVIEFVSIFEDVPLDLGRINPRYEVFEIPVGH